MWAFIKLVGWGFVLLVIWPYIEISRKLARKPRMDNCVTWAVRRWNENPGSYLVIRWCRSSRTDLKWPHFLWLPAEKHTEMKHFLPLVDQQETKFVPDAFFDGKVVTGDYKEEIEN